MKIMTESLPRYDRYITRQKARNTVTHTYIIGYPDHATETPTAAVPPNDDHETNHDVEIADSIIETEDKAVNNRFKSRYCLWPNVSL